jgi:hypothetical protein
MRAIILIQSIIIVVGAYYIYTMSHAVTAQPVAPVIDMVPKTTPTEIHEGYVAPTTQPPKDIPVSTTTKSKVTGPNDAGMEYPTNPDVNYPDQPVRPQ